MAIKTQYRDSVLLPGTAWIMILLIPITFFGFYPSYFSRLTTPMPIVIHLHSAFMLLWLATAVAQPLLIKFNKLSWHRFVGKISYVLMPVVIISGYFILRFSYQRALSGEAVGPEGYFAEDLPLHIKAAEFVVIGSVYWIWLMVYYTLGVYFRKKLVTHATFMLAAALTILGPAGDRLIGHICDAMGWPFNAVAVNLVFALVSVIFFSLLLAHKQKKLSLQPTLTVLLIHGIGIFLFYFMPHHPIWNKMAAFLYN